MKKIIMSIVAAATAILLSLGQCYKSDFKSDLASQPLSIDSLNKYQGELIHAITLENALKIDSLTKEYQELLNRYQKFAQFKPVSTTLIVTKIDTIFDLTTIIQTDTVEKFVSYCKKDEWLSLCVSKFESDSIPTVNLQITDSLSVFTFDRENGTKVFIQNSNPYIKTLSKSIFIAGNKQATTKDKRWIIYPSLILGVGYTHSNKIAPTIGMGLSFSPPFPIWKIGRR